MERRTKPENDLENLQHHITFLRDDLAVVASETGAYRGQDPESLASHVKSIYGELRSAVRLQARMLDTITGSRVVVSGRVFRSDGRRDKQDELVELMSAEVTDVTAFDGSEDMIPDVVLRLSNGTSDYEAWYSEISWQPTQQS